MTVESQFSISIIANDEDVRDRLCGQLGKLGSRIDVFSYAPPQPSTGHDAEIQCVVLHLDVLNEEGLQRVEALIGPRRRPIVLIVDTAPVSLVVKAMKRGVADVLESASVNGNLAAAVRRAVDDCASDHDQIAQREAARKAIERLTPREREVLHGIVNGKASKGIAADLCISPRTVDAHRWRIGQKLQVGRLGGIVRIAVLAGEA